MWCLWYNDVSPEESKKTEEKEKTPERRKSIHSARKKSEQKEKVPPYRSCYLSGLISHMTRPLHAINKPAVPLFYTSTANMSFKKMIMVPTDGTTLRKELNTPGNLTVLVRSARKRNDLLYDKSIPDSQKMKLLANEDQSYDSFRDSVKKQSSLGAHSER